MHNYDIPVDFIRTTKRNFNTMLTINTNKILPLSVITLFDVFVMNLAFQFQIVGFVKSKGTALFIKSHII
jgi:hypothetical protein